MGWGEGIDPVYRSSGQAGHATSVPREGAGAEGAGVRNPPTPVAPVHPHPSLPPSRGKGPDAPPHTSAEGPHPPLRGFPLPQERVGDGVPAFAGTTGATPRVRFALTHALECAPSPSGEGIRPLRDVSTTSSASPLASLNMTLCAALRSTWHQGWASMRMKAMTQGASPRLFQLWTVARCTSTSPTCRWTSTPSSSSMSISPEITTA